MPKALKIGFVVDDTLDKTDGVQQYVLTLGAWLSSQGHEVHYLAGETKRQDLPNVHSLSRNFKVRFNGNRLSIPLPANKRRIKQLLATEKFDVLHVQMPFSPWLAGRIVRAAPDKTAVIGTFHIAPYSSLVTIGTKLLAIWSRRALKRFSAIVSVSSAAAEFAATTYGLQTPILPNVIDYAKFQTAKPFAQYEDDQVTILFLGRLVPRKGCQLLLSAVAELYKSPDLVPKFRVLICGSGPLETSLKAYVQQQGLQDIVIFTGFVNETDKPHYYASADIAVFPSSGGESFGIVLTEAMASGTAAVLGGDNSGYRSVLGIRPELLFDPHDSAELAAKLRHYLTDTPDRESVAAWGAEYCQQFDTAMVGKQLVAIYTQALR